MKGVELYARIRRAVSIEGMSRREAARLFGVDRRTVDKMLRFSVPPGYRRNKPPARPKLDPFTASLTGFWKKMGRARRSSVILRSGYLNVYVMSTALPAA
jgi:hypothetical protein